MSQPHHHSSSQVSPNHQSILDAFRTDLQASPVFDPTRHTDALLLRFLRARRFDPVKAKAMFLDCEQWRIDFNVSTIVATFAFPERPAVHRLYPRYYHKTDKLGRPIYIEFLGNLDVKHLLTITTIDRMLHYHVREYEKLCHYRLPACSVRAGHPVEQNCTILDLKGVRLSEFNGVRKIVQRISQIAQDYYPETLGRMYIINAPSLFTTIWVVVKAFLDEATVQKISVLGGNYAKILLDDIQPENLPEAYGGQCRCAGGCDAGDCGPWNDGLTSGYPQQFWEEMAKRDGGAVQPVCENALALTSSGASVAVN